MKAKRCPLCGGQPQFKYYAVPACKCPDGWEYTEDGYEPMILAKRLECVGCHATVPFLVLSCEDAVQAWNDEQMVQFIGQEPVMDLDEDA
jgi:hypothetical protein